MQGKLLILDDNERVFESLEINFRQFGFNCVWAANGAEALRLARDCRLLAAIIDLSLQDEDGVDVMRRLFAVQSDMPAIVITGFGSFADAVRATKLGAYDFLAKPLNFDKLNEVLHEALKMTGSGGTAAAAGANDRVVVHSPAIQSLWDRAARIAATDIPVLVTGESGTGKELVAERIHERSARSAGKFIRVNCSAIADTLADSELFGHRKGSFTGAVGERTGLIREADGGTLHLDEIGDMPLSVQAKLLRVLEDKRLRPVGSEQEYPVDVRIVASTNKNLERMIDEGGFRSDLFYRLNAVELHIPPLRERRGDILPLIQHFLRKFSDAGSGKRFSDKAVGRLCEYAWPGNVRELRNVVKVSSAIAPGPIIEYEDLPPSVRLPSRSASVSGRIIDAEKGLIVKALEESGGNRQIASKSLGISRRTLYNKMKAYGLES